MREARLGAPKSARAMTSGRRQSSLGSILEIFAAPIRQIFAGIDAPAIAAPIVHVFTQPGSKNEPATAGLAGLRTLR
jgi:hypothetical protein